MSARKVPENLENPIDNILIEIAGVFNPLFYKVGFSPNGITSLSLIFGILSCYFYYIKSYLLSSVTIFISYYFDIMDGNFARQYNMQTKFGDYYDHIKDVMVMSTISILILLNTDLSIKVKLIGMFIGGLLLYTSVTHLGCIEQYVIKSKDKSNVESSPTLSIFKKNCNNLNKIKSIRYLATGTFNVFISLFILVPLFITK